MPEPEVSEPWSEMRREEWFSYRVFVLCILGLAALTLAVLPFLSGNPWLKTLLAGVDVVAVPACAFFAYHFRRYEHFDYRKATGIALGATVNGNIAVVYWGLFSTAPTLIVVGIYFFARSASPTLAFAIYALDALTIAVLSSLVLGGVMDDPGLFSGADRTTLELVITQLMVQAVYLLAYVLARASWRSSFAALDRVQSAQREVEQQQAWVDEMRDDLERVMRVAGPGQLSGHTLAGYRLGELIGRGAMGEIYEATSHGASHPVAIKLLHATVLDDEELVDRFIREAEATSSFDSPHVVRVLEASRSSDAVPFLVMERLVGQDLAHHLRQRHRLEPLEVVQLAEQVATVIDEAAKKGIVHRDLKPQNLFFDEREPERPCWKVLDFGVSKLLGSGTVAQNRLLGTPTYMAPEQARGNEVDSRADLYALGVVVYRALTGRPAFRGDDISALLLQVVHQMPTVPSDLGDLPEAVDDVLLLAMAKRPEDRYASASEFAGALREALLEGTVSDRALVLRAADVRQRQPWRRDVQRLESEDETTLVAGRERLS